MLFFQLTEIEKRERHMIEQIKESNAVALTHGGKFHADDVFSTALLFYINPQIKILRKNQVPDDFTGLVYDIGRGAFDHHQKDSRIRENGVPYAAFGLLWEALGADILGEELAGQFDEEFVQPLDCNDNTGEKNELASLIGSFNPSWDEEGGSDDAFFEAVSVAGKILEHKFLKYQANGRADEQVERVLLQHEQAVLAGEKPDEEKILVLKEFVPCQKKLKETEIEFVVFPSNRGGYCIQPQKREHSMNYKCSFPERWLGLEKEELQKESGLKSASFCHKGGFLMTVDTLEDAIEACKISQREYRFQPVVVTVTKDCELDPQMEKLLREIPGMERAKMVRKSFSDIPKLTSEHGYDEVALEKQEWKQLQKEKCKELLAEKPEAVYVDGTVWETYPVVHLLRKKKITVLTKAEVDGEICLIRIPSGS